MDTKELSKAIPNPSPSNPPKNEEKKKPAYISKPGFEEGKIFRGLKEIEQLQELIDTIKADCFICGGYVRYMCSPDPSPIKAGDVDIYSYDDDAFELIKNTLMKKAGLTIRHENAISVTFHRVKDAHHPLFGTPTIQIIKPTKEGSIVSVGEMETVLENFDFTVVRCGIQRGEILIDADFMHDEERKILRLKNIHCPVSSTLRCMKYSRKGYWLPPTQALELFLDWERRPDSYKLQLKEFLSKTKSGEGLTQEQIDELEAMMRID